MLFKSKLVPGAVMNQYGTVLRQGVVCGPVTRGKVITEAKAAGWTLQRSSDRDVGMVYCPPAAPEEGKGAE